MPKLEGEFKEVSVQPHGTGIFLWDLLRQLSDYWAEHIPGYSPSSGAILNNVKITIFWEEGREG